MEGNLLEVAGGLGVGALLGMVMFLCYRQDRKNTEDRLSQLLKADQETREQNTRAIAELTTWLKDRNGHT
jgi:hypothetical protein